MNMKTWADQDGRAAGWGAAVVAAGLVLAGCGPQKGSGGPPPGGVPEVAVVTVQPEAVTLSNELPGRVSAFLVAEVRPQVSGIVQKRLFEEGADVKAGDALYQIDPSLYEAALASAKAAQGKVEANLTTLRARAERYKDLVAVKAVSSQEYDDITAALKQAEAEMEAVKAAVETARINVGFTRIPAPISGRVGRSSVTIGALATAYQGVPFATVQQLDPVYVDAPQSSAILLRLKRNMANGNLKGDDAARAKVRLILEDGTAYPHEGTLQFSDVTVDSSTGSFILRMVFPNPDRTLLPGMFVRAVVQEGLNDKAILIPQPAVSRDPKGNPLALVVTPEGKVDGRPLTLGRAIGDRWLVHAGLVAGDRVIVEGSLKVRPGMPAKAVPFEKAAAAKPPENKPGPATKPN